MAKRRKKQNFDITKHDLVPKHAKVSEAEKKRVLEKYKVEIIDLPKVYSTDPAIQKLELKAGDLVKITRQSQTSNTTVFYRVVIDE
jgi:DNA-directed RNA polymerase subunit H (RpoH/RPB5)